MKNFSFHHDVVMGGCRVLYAFAGGNPFPAGFIWHTGAQHGATALGYIWVHNDVRRQGIGTAMIGELRAWLSGRELFTETTFCEPFLVSLGFRREPDGWYLPPMETKQ